MTIRRPLVLKDYTEHDMSTPEGRTKINEMRAAAVRLRNYGASVDLIADKLGVTPRDAETLIDSALRETMDESTEAMVARQQAVLNDMTRALYPGMLQGDPNSSGTLLRVLEYGGKLHGLPKQQRTSTAIDKDAAALDITGVLQELGYSSPQTPIEEDETPWSNID
jgi:hypothetical protein